MSPSRAPYRVLLFDLFGTLIFLRSAPRGQSPAPAYAWLRAALEREVPGLAFDDFVRALVETSQEIAAGREPEYREVPSRERFRRALARTGVAGADAAARAERLSLAHMAHLATLTDMPAEHGALVRELAGRYPLALVSNFDHGPTAAAILERHGLREHFAVAIVSADFGRRKPHPAIFAEALQRVGVAAAEALFIGDTPEDDVAGAQAAGVDVAWINRAGVPPPEPPPTYTLRRLDDLRELLHGGRRDV